jgi:hypothetical protein
MKKLLRINILTVIFFMLLFPGCIEDSGPGISGAGKPIFNGGASSKSRTASTIEVTAEILKENGSKITERGFCYGTSPSPTLENGDTIRDAGIGVGSYTLKIKGLKHNTKYYIRPYAINGYGVEYGTPDLPDSTNIGTGTVVTLKSDEYASEAVTGGRIDDVGEGEIKRRGVYYSTEKDLDIAVKDSVESTDDTNTYSCRLTGLTPSTTYYIQAYVENTYDLFKGDIDSVVTRDGMPHFADFKITNPGYTDVKLTATVTNGDDKTVTIIEQGFCWTLFPEQPTISNNMVKCDKDENGYFEETITGLVAQQHYTVRAYAISSVNETQNKAQYSNDTSFYTKADIPTVETNDVINVQNGGADVKGRIIDGGLSPVVKAGICWSPTTEIPTIDNDSILPLPVGSNGVMSGKLTNLRGGVTYYVRAFATNENGSTSYGDVVSFPTPSIFKTDLPPFTGAMRWPGSTAYFAIDDKLYLLGGDLGPDYTNELYSYSISEKRWDEHRAFIGGAAKWQSGIRYGKGAYVYGGIEYDENGVEKPKPGLYYYNANTNSWEERNPGADTLYQTAGCAFGGNILYIGGRRDTVKQDVWAFDAALNSWSKKTDFPVKQYGGIAVVLDGVIYAGMGRDDQDVCNGNLWTTTTTGGATTWTLKTSCEIYSEGILAGIANILHHRIYVIDEDFYILEYNPADDVWTRKSRLPLGSIHCMYYDNGKIYIGLGSASNTLIVYDPLWDN